VIDFGVAKALGQKLAEKTLFTAFNHMIGTPAYMSPEQAALSGLDIDTRADIYSLGVLLYELLTGVTPFDAETFRKAALDVDWDGHLNTNPLVPNNWMRLYGGGLNGPDKLGDWLNTNVFSGARMSDMRGKPRVVICCLSSSTASSDIVLGSRPSTRPALRIMSVPMCPGITSDTVTCGALMRKSLIRASVKPFTANFAAL